MPRHTEELEAKEVEKTTPPNARTVAIDTCISSRIFAALSDDLQPVAQTA